MKLKEFTNLVGVSEYFVKTRISRGEIKAEKIPRNESGSQFYFEIDASEVDKWRKIVNDGKASDAGLNKKKVSKRDRINNTPLRQVDRQLKELQKEIGYISYGEAVAKGLIKDKMEDI